VSDDPSKVVPNERRYTISGNAEQALAEFDAFRALGVTHFMVRFMTFENLTYFVEHVAPYVTRPRAGTARLTSGSL
jgi:alkanesulfonate monooxygenase SsuD/methylene tetrahydromethanopterin reductase-like flavin-dependent oxidoreductase (luciferase family)